jgi:hypothetical protein
LQAFKVLGIPLPTVGDNSIDTNEVSMNPLNLTPANFARTFEPIAGERGRAYLEVPVDNGWENGPVIELDTKDVFEKHGEIGTGARLLICKVEDGWQVIGLLA